VLAAATLGVTATSTAAAAHATKLKPSPKDKMICAKEVKRELAGVLAVKPTTVSKPTWVDQLYSCTYTYRDGAFTISVKDLPNKTAALAYFEQLAANQGKQTDNVPLGDAAFITPNGSMIVRKDHHVLDVDAAQLPPQLTMLKLSPADVASSVATTVLGCWT
jgi:hypothetical protein